MHSKFTLHTWQRPLWALLLLSSVGLGASACAGRTQSDAGQAGGSGGAPIIGGSKGGMAAGNASGEGATAGEPASGGMSSGTSSGGAPATASGGSGIGSTSGSVVTACSNGKDDDGDGAIDGFDPECTGAIDDDEGTFATGIPGDNRDPKWQDCFFDGNSGAGDDHCRYSTLCLTGELPSDARECTLTQSCLDFCAPLTPSGCDCFGCCTVVLGSGKEIDIQIGASCSLDKALDSTACPVCQKSTQCENDCGKCDLCAGKTVEDLDPSCVPEPPPPGTEPPPPGTEPPPSYTCEAGQAKCGPDLPACSGSEYCSQGCCIISIR